MPKSVKSMTNSASMDSKKAVEEEVVPPMISFPCFSEVELEEEDEEDHARGRVSTIPSRFLWRICTMETVKLAINRQVIIGDATMCASCDGQGIVVELRQIALGMVQQVQKRCPTCTDGYVCKTKKERKVLEVHVEKGMKNGQKVSFRGMADEKPNMEPGDINFIVQEKEHDVFKRKGADLLITKTLSLNEALCGFEFEITHLDKRKIVIKSTPGEIIKPETLGGQPYVKIVSKEGMPSKGNPFVKGDLYVLFRVEFPVDGELDTETVATIKKALPNPSMDLEYDEEEVEICHLDGADVKNFGKGGAAETSGAYDSDEEDPNQNVECRQS
eukprot:572601_1